MSGKPCQCGHDYELLKSWTDLATKQVQGLKRFSFLADPYGDIQQQENLGKQKELFWQSTERMRYFQKLVGKSCGIDMSQANKNIFKAEEDVRNNEFGQADVELSESELKTIIGLSACASSR